MHCEIYSIRFYSTKHFILRYFAGVIGLPGCDQTVATSNLKHPNNLLALRILRHCNTCQPKKKKIAERRI